jgi:hypothetical protein
MFLKECIGVFLLLFFKKIYNPGIPAITLNNLALCLPILPIALHEINTTGKRCNCHCEEKCKGEINAAAK